MPVTPAIELILAFSKEEPTPAWVPLVAFAVPVVIMLLVLRWALRRRRKWKKSTRAQAGRRQSHETAMGIASSIDDPTAYSTEALLKAMAVKPEEHGPTADGMPHDEGWGGTMLGLKSKIATNAVVSMPHVYWGIHDGRQVFVRLGADEKLEGATTFLTERHLRSITVLRVDSPRFQLAGADGRLSLLDGPTELTGVLAPIGASDDIWNELSVWGGPEGIVATRPSATDFAGGGWVYDLWLLERIARVMRLEPLPDARIGPAWKVPYRLGRDLEPRFD